MDARATLKAQRPSLMGEFERRMRGRVNDGIAGKVADKTEYSKTKVDVDKLTLVDTSRMLSPLSLVPFVNLVAPLYAGLAFTCFCLGELDELRRRASAAVEG